MICKINIFLGEIQATPCIHLMGTVGKKNFYTANKELTWFGAVEYCHGIGMSLAVLESDREVMVIEDYLRHCPCKLYLSVRKACTEKESNLLKEKESKYISQEDGI